MKHLKTFEEIKIDPSKVIKANPILKRGNVFGEGDHSKNCKCLSCKDKRKSKSK
jgi:hypothetical protein